MDGNANLANAIYRLERAVIALYRALDIMSLRGTPPTREEVDALRDKLEHEYGIKVD